MENLHTSTISNHFHGCRICGSWEEHKNILQCPQVQEVEFYENGTVKRIVKKTT